MFRGLVGTNLNPIMPERLREETSTGGVGGLHDLSLFTLTPKTLPETLRGLGHE